MLIHLAIKDFTVIESASFDIGKGLNIITGETGAGKSVMIKALSLLLGQRSGPELIRTGSLKASVAATFLVKPGHHSLQILEELDLGIETHEIHVRRVVSAKGRTRNFVNDIPVSAHGLARVSSALLDIFGQHENHSILSTNYHTHLLDQFLPNRSAKADYSKIFQNFTERMQVAKNLVEIISKIDRDADFLKFRLSEFDDLGPTEKDFEGLAERQKRAASISDDLGALREVIAIIDGGTDQEQAMSRTLSKCARLVQKINFDPALRETVQRDLEAATELLSSTSFRISQAADHCSESFSWQAADEQRLDHYYELMRKMDCNSISELILQFDELRTTMEQQTDLQQQLDKDIDDIVKIYPELQKAAATLSQERLKAKGQLEIAVQRELKDVGLEHAQLIADLQPRKRSDTDTTVERVLGQRHPQFEGSLNSFGVSGAENVRFLFSANPGSNLMPLEKVASGGEISRIMLALKSVFMHGGETCVMVFDEIDTGISGRVADLVGCKLHGLAQNCQVICISHLPQVAAYADRHFSVRKNLQKGRAESEIRPLDGEARLKELAQLLSGSSITANSVANAQEMLTNAVNRQT
jgi:DNA repair protein RecN (Recombination protein N)